MARSFPSSFLTKKVTGIMSCEEVIIPFSTISLKSESSVFVFAYSCFRSSILSSA